MKDSILIQTLNVFSNEELDELLSFLESPFYNQGSHARQNVALFSLLKEIIQKENWEKLDRMWVSKKLLGTNFKNKDSRYLDNRMSELMSVIRKFIAQQELNNSWGETFERIAVSRFYKNRDLTHLQERSIHKARTLALKKPITLLENPILQFWLDEEIFKMESFRNLRKGDLNIPSTIKSLSIFYATKLLEISLSEVQQGRVDPEFSSTWNVMIKDMRRLFRIYEFCNSPTLIMLEEALILIEDQSEDPITQLQEYIQKLQKYKDTIPLNSVKNLATYARNYCTTKINQGYRGFRDMRIAMYKEHLEEGWLYENGKLIPSTFINMINTGLWSGENEWVHHLLTNYKDKISGTDQGKSILYGFALYHAYNKEFKEATSYLNELLQSKKFGDRSLERLVRVLEIKLLYEENDDLIHTQLHNFLMFIRRSERIFNKESRQMHIKFIKILKKISKLKEDIIQKAIDDKKLTAQISKMEEQLNTPLSPIVERLWLLKKLKELEVKEGQK